MIRPLDIAFGTLVRHAPLLLGLALAVLAVFILGQRFGILGERLTLHPDSLANGVGGTSAREVEIYSLLPRDGIRSIDQPKLVSGDAAAGQMADSELVLGLVIDGEARAYPINMLSRHEIVNDVVAGVPIAVTYCPLCFTGIVFDRRIDGETLEFGVSGKLVMNDLVMYDRQTGSLWQQILGEGIRGRFLGEKLTPLPAVHTTWRQWRTIHPDTAVLDKGGGYDRDSYGAYYGRGDRGVIPGSGGDPRLDGKALVLGVVAAATPKAYPFDSLASSAVVNDSVGGTAIAVFYDARSQTAVVMDRRLDGRELSFDLAPQAEPGHLVVVDRETGTSWSALSSEALSGPLAGQRVTQLPATYAFWVAWSDFYTQTELYEAC